MDCLTSYLGAWAKADMKIDVELNFKHKKGEEVIFNHNSNSVILSLSTEGFKVDDGVAVPDWRISDVDYLVAHD